MRWTRLLACVVALPFTARLALAQDVGRVSGTVSEGESGIPVPGATVVIKGTRIGAIANDSGRYTIVNVPVGRWAIRATLIGYAPVEDSVTVVAGQTASVSFRMRHVAVTLDRVVTIGYGTQKKSDLTGAVSSVTPEVDRTPITSLEQTLQGAAAGVQVTTASSAPGGGISIRVRGGSSVNGNNEPLYVVDGFPIENDAGNASPGTGGRDNTAPANPLSAINPSDIASIEILKDASATSIYGARGANGVVIITTKRGSAGKPKVTIDSYTGMQEVAKTYDLLNAQQFAQYANEWALAAGRPADSLPYPNPAALGAGTNWQDLIFRTAPINNLQMGVSGGTAGDNATRYAISGGVFQQKGIVYGSDFRRVSLRGNVDQAVGKRLKLGSNLLVSRVNSSQVPTDGSFNSGAGAVGAAIQYLPVLPVRQPDGTYTLLQANLPVELSSIGVSTGNVPNPVASAFEINDRLADTRMLANAAGEFTLLKGLSVRSTLGTDISDRTRDTYYPRTTAQGFGLNGRALRGRVENTSFLNENTLNYQGKFGDIHSVQAVAGYTRQSLNTVRTNMNNSNFVSDNTGFESIGAGSAPGGPGVSSGHSKWTLASYLGRINYTLLDRYLFTATGRRDGSSRFGADHRWGFFPSGAIGWKVSEEPFVKDLNQRFGDQLSLFKLRGSFGWAGNPSIQPYQSTTRLCPQQYSFNGTIAPGYYPCGIGNDALSWEATRQLDLGGDLGLWNGRVDATYDHYYKRTKRLLLGIDLPSESGYSTALVNAGSIENEGYELGVTVHVIPGDTKRGAFGWTTTVNYAHNRNAVLSLGGVNRIFASSTNSDIGSAGSVVQLNQPIGAFFGYKTDGIFRDSAEVAEYTKTTRLSSGTISPGQIRIVDVNGDGVINADDRTVIGDPTPKFTVGWQNTVNFKGFELSTLLDGTYGNDVLNLNLYRTEGASPSTNISVARFKDRWTPENHDAKYPRINSTPGALGADFTDQILEDGSFLRLRTVTISREIPERWLGGRGMGARVYVTGQNLKTWTKYSGFNPDVSSLGVGNTNRGIDVGAYPLARTWTAGLNLSY